MENNQLQIVLDNKKKEVSFQFMGTEETFVLRRFLTDLSGDVSARILREDELKHLTSFLIKPILT